MSLENNARPPEYVPDVSGNGRWQIWEFAGTKIDSPLFGNGDIAHRDVGLAGEGLTALDRMYED